MEDWRELQFLCCSRYQSIESAAKTVKRERKTEYPPAALFVLQPERQLNPLAFSCLTDKDPLRVKPSAKTLVSKMHLGKQTRQIHSKITGFPNKDGC